jgi:PKD repeat protein
MFVQLPGYPPRLGLDSGAVPGKPSAVKVRLVLAVLLTGCAWAAITSTALAVTPYNMHYYGGPVLHSEQLVLVQWGPDVASWETAPTSGVPGFMQDLESRSGSTNALGAVAAQYGDLAGSFTGAPSWTTGNAANSYSYGGTYEISSPTSGAGGSAATVQDTSIQTQLSASIANGELPAPLDNGQGTVYVILFPPKDTICMDGSCSDVQFCAYHSGFFQTSPANSQVLYAVIPDTSDSFWNTGEGCGEQTAAISNETSAMSHELIETQTDPLVNATSNVSSPLGWYQTATYSPTGESGEVADICDTGQTSSDALNGGGGWYVQKIWSNLDQSCTATESSAYSAPTAVITPPATLLAGASASFEGGGSTDPASNQIAASATTGLTLTAPIGPGISSYSWSWGDGSADSGGADPTHTYAGRGTYLVTLKVTDDLGFTASTSQEVVVVGPNVRETTEAATAISAGGATLNGVVEPNGAGVAYHFAWGTSAQSLTNSSPVVATVTGTTAVPVSVSISGLLPHTTYYYELIATDPGGASIGPLLSFVTLSSAPQATTGAATSVSRSSATVHGTVNPFGLDTTYYFQYGTSTGYGKSTAHLGAGVGTSAAAVSGDLRGLTPGTEYHYRLVASSSAGIVDGADRHFKTAGKKLPALSARFKVVSGQTIGNVLAGGLSIRVTCNQACRVAISVRNKIAAAVANKTTPVVLAGGHVTLKGAGTKTVRVNLNRVGKRQLRSARKLKIVIQGLVSSTGNQHEIPIAAAVTLKRA